VYVRPILEYNCVTWSPQLTQDTEKIERVQKRYTNRLHGFANVPYSERLRIGYSYIAWSCLEVELRRLFFDLYVLSHYFWACKCV